MPRRWKIFIIVGLLSLFADQASKIWARAQLPTQVSPRGHVSGETVEVIPNYWAWRLSENPGSAFGLFGNIGGARIFLSVIGVLVVGVIFWMQHKAREDQTRLAWALGLIAGGAIGNLIDRIAFGVVTDFIVWKYHSKEWPTFNIADVTLVVGMGLLLLDMSKEAKAEAAAAAANAGQGSAVASKAGKSKKKKS